MDWSEPRNEVIHSTAVGAQPTGKLNLKTLQSMKLPDLKAQLTNILTTRVSETQLFPFYPSLEHKPASVRCYGQ